MSRAVIQPFEEYQRARIIFVQTVAALAGGKDNRNVELLKRLDAIRLLGPLLTDPVISIKQYAALAIGTLAGADEEIASQVVNDDDGHILDLILKSLVTSNRFYKKTACRLLGKLSKWKNLATKVVNGGVIKFLVGCLQDCDGEVKLFACSALQKICMNGEELAYSVIREGAIEPLSLCLQEPDIKLKRQAVLTMSNIAKHSEKHTKSLCEEKDTLGVILHYLETKDTMLRRQVLLCLSYISQNASDKAAQIINSIKTQLLEENIAGVSKTNIYNIRQDDEVTPTRKADPICQQNCLSLLYNIAKHGTPHTSQVSAKIKCETLIKFLETNHGPARNVGLQVISTLAEFSKEQAEQIKRLDGQKVLALCLYEQKPETISYACNAINNMANYPNPDITNGLVEDLSIKVGNEVKYYNIPYRLLELCLNKQLPSYLVKNARQALESIIANNVNLNALIPLLDRPNYGGVDDAQFEQILSKIVQRIHALLGEFKPYKKLLIENKTLKKLIKLRSKYKSLDDDLKSFSDYYSQEIINYYSDEYEQKIREQVIQSLS